MHSKTGRARIHSETLHACILRKTEEWARGQSSSCSAGHGEANSDWLTYPIALADAALTAAQLALGTLGDGSQFASIDARTLGPGVAACCVGLKK